MVNSKIKKHKNKKSFLPKFDLEISDDDFYKIVTKIAKRLSYRFKFGYMDNEDIAQECYLLAREALDRYDGKRPLEHFLSVHLRNRLSNFRRDNFTRLDAVCQKIQNDKKSIMEPLDISLVDTENEESMKVYDDVISKIRTKEIISAINPHIGPGFKRLYKKFIKTGKIARNKRKDFIEHIRELIVKYGKTSS